MDKKLKGNILTLLFFSLGSFLLAYLTSMIFARAMGANGYDDYAVAISSLAILATLSEMGTGKFGLRIIPVFREKKMWNLARGYLRFSVRLILLVSLILLIATVVIEYLEDGEFGNYALGLAILFLPVIAWAGAGSEIIMANGASILSALITRILIPAAILVLGGIWIFSSFDLNAIQGVLIYGMGWVIGLFAVIVFLRQTTPTAIRKAVALYNSREWSLKALPFLFFALLLTILTKIAVIILEIVHPEEATVAVYAVAAETGAFIYLIAKSTDKMYLPELSLMIERKDRHGMLALRKQRWTRLGSTCFIFLIVVIVLGKKILLLFGPEFVDGYTALTIVAVATVVWTMASLAPSYLKYIGKHRFVIISTTITVFLHIGLCFPLGYYYGATGAAISFAVPVTVLYLTMAAMVGYYDRKTSSKGKRNENQINI
jgi:O-antigen/teichoic acid export membrane protein